MGLVGAIIVAAIVGVVIAQGMRRRLNRLEYRLRADPDTDTIVEADGMCPSNPTNKPTHDRTDPRPDDDTDGDGTPEPDTAAIANDDLDETQLPSPGQRWWMLAVLGLTWAGIVWSLCAEAMPHGLSDWARLATWLAFSAVGLWLAVIDLDVQRLPDRGQIVLAGAVVIGGVLTYWNEPVRWAIGLGAALACGLAFLVVHLVSKGGLGLGDVKLVMTCGWWLAATSPVTIVAAIAAACVLGLIYCLIIHSRQFAFGPWLIAGALLAGLTY